MIIKVYFMFKYSAIRRDKIAHMLRPIKSIGALHIYLIR